MGARNRGAAVAYSAAPTILPSSKKTLAKSSRPWSVAKRCLTNDGEGDLYLAVRAAARPRRRFHRDQRSARRRAPKRTAHFTCERGTLHCETLGVLPTWVPATAMLPLRIERHLPSCHRRRKRSRNPAVLGQLRSGVSPTTVKAIYIPSLEPSSRSTTNRRPPALARRR